MVRIIRGRRHPRPATAPEALLVPQVGITGRQLAAVVVALSFAFVLYPAGAHAAGTLMTIVDPTTTSKAKVDTTGALKVGDGTGPLTVDGGVRQALQANPWHYDGFIGGPGTEQTIFNPPTGVTKLAITSLTYAGLGNSSEPQIRLHGSAGCVGSFLGAQHSVYLPANTTVHADFPTPLVINVTAGQSVCFSGSPNTNLSAVGFYQ